MTKRLSLPLLCALMIAVPAHGREIISATTPENGSVYANLEFDSAFVLSSGYARTLQHKLFGKTVTLAADAGTVLFQPDVNDGIASASARINLYESGSFKLINRVGVSVKTTSNEAFSLAGVGVSEGILFGKFSNKSFFAAELDYQKYLYTYVQYTDWYLTNVYAGARSGWYRDTGGRIQLGITNGHRWGGFQLGFRAGIQRTEALNSFRAGPGFYISTAFIFNL